MDFLSLITRVSGSEHPNDRRLSLMLDAALACPAKLPERTKRWRALLGTEKGLAERVDFDIWYMETHAMRCYEAAKERKELLASLDTRFKINEEIDKCRADTNHFIRYWCWSFDPRPDSILTEFPIVPFEEQENLVSWIDDVAFHQFRNGTVLKSRSMGASYIVCFFGVAHWLFSPPSETKSFLYLSKKYESADEIGNINSLLEKVRFTIRRVPSFFLPPGLVEKTHFKEGAILNPYNRCMISCDSFTGGSGAGDRATICFVDEAAIGDSATQTRLWGTLTGGTANTTIMVSTPRGSRNQFADNYRNPDIPHFDLHWTKNPLIQPSDRPDLHGIWYERKKKQMNNPALAAQELDMAFDASQPGKVFPQYDEAYNVITWKEFSNLFPSAYEGPIAGYAIPRSFTIGCAADIGGTQGHPTVILWVACAPEGSALPGSVFVYRELVISEAWEASRIARAIRDAELKAGEGARVTHRLISHEQSSLQMTLAREHDLYFQKANVKSNSDGSYGGIAQIQDYLALRGESPHPFRPELPQAGAPRLYFIVDDRQGKLEISKEGRIMVRAPVDSAGLKRIRQEMAAYHYDEKLEGESVQRMRPHKFFDDAVDALRYLARQFFPPIGDAPLAQRVWDTVPERLRPDNFEGLHPQERAIRYLELGHHLEMAQKSIGPQPSKFDRAMSVMRSRMGGRRGVR